MPPLAAILADGPVGYWPLDDRQGVTAPVDYGSVKQNGTLSGTPAFGNRGVPCGGTAPRVNKATPDWVSIADNAAWSSGAGANGVLTVECLVYLVSYSAVHSMVMTKGNTSNYEWSLAVTSNGSMKGEAFTLAAGTNVGNLTATGPGVALNVWTHIAMTFDRASSTIGLFRNGARDPGTASFNVGNNMSDGTSVIALGYRADNPGASNFATDGHIAHAAVYGKVLTAAQIGRHAQACLARPPVLQRRRRR